MRPLRPSFVVTVSATCVLACTRSFTSNPPPGGRTRPSDTGSPSATAPPSGSGSGSPAAATSTGRSDTADGGNEAAPRLQDYPVPRNPLEQGRTVFKDWKGDNCYVELNWPPGKQRMPGEEPPHRPVMCPTEMRDTAWEECRGGAISQAAGDARCICLRMGNPPPLPTRVTCPR